MTKEWKLVRIVLILCAVALCLWVILGFLDYSLASKNATNLANCQAQLNYSTNQWITMFNNTIKPALGQNSTITI